MKMAEMTQLKKLVEVVARLRRECPWDKVQTHQSLTRYLIEEAHETVDAIESGSMDAFREELGDVLLQVVLHSEIAKQAGVFSLEDVAGTISEKMIRRHPHVFGEGEARDAGHVKENWEKIKAAERTTKKKSEGLLGGVPTGMAGLLVAQRYGEKASSIKFDWKDAGQVLAKVKEEIGELEAEIKAGDSERLADELGDVFFALANLARHLGLDAESVAKRGARKFATRVASMEKQAATAGRALHEYSADELERLWEKAKSDDDA